MEGGGGVTFKGMQRLKRFCCPSLVFLEPLPHLHCVRGGDVPMALEFRGCFLHSPLLWGCPRRLGVSSSVSFSSGPLNKLPCLGYVAGRMLCTEPEKGLRDVLGNGDATLSKRRCLGSAVGSTWGWGGGQSCAPSISRLTSLWWLMVQERLWVQRTDLWLISCRWLKAVF